MLSKFEYFGQYGSIVKIVVNKNKAYNPEGPNGPSYSAYISYSSSQEASVALLSVDNVEVDGHVIKASFGTTKYCTFFLKNFDCPNKECLYLHYLAQEDDIIHKEDMSNYSHRNIFYEQQLLAIRLANLYHFDVRQKLCNMEKGKTVFPSTDMLYEKDIVIQNEPEETYNKTNNWRTHNSRFQKKYEYDDRYGDYYGDNYGDHSTSSNNFNHVNSRKLSYECSDKHWKKKVFDDYNKYPENEEEVEYILVKEDKYTRSKKNKMNKAKKNNYNFNSKKEKKQYQGNKFKSEDDSNSNSTPFPDRITNPNSDNGHPMSGGENPRKLKKQFLQSVEESRLTLALTASSLENKTPELLTPVKSENIYRQRENSRFEFVKSQNSKCNTNSLSNDTSSTEVPDFISKMLYKKISRFTFFKKFEIGTGNDILLFENELKNNNNNSWAQFISSNLHLDHESEGNTNNSFV